MDLVLKVGADAEVIQVNSSLLRQKSAWFNSILSGRWNLEKTEDGKMVVKLPVDNPDGIRLFLKLIGNDFSVLQLRHENDIDVIKAIFELVEKFDTGDLRQNLCRWCESAVEEFLNPDNLTWFYSRVKERDFKLLRDVVCKSVARNITKFWKTKVLFKELEEAWLELDEYAITSILSDNALFHTDALKDFELPDANEAWNPQEECASLNELLILSKAVDWILAKKNVGAYDYDPDFPMRILQRVRFPTMNRKDLDEAMDRVASVLTSSQIQEILNWSTFKPDQEPRSIPAVPRIKCWCNNCSAYTIWEPWTNDDGDHVYDCGCGYCSEKYEKSHDGDNDRDLYS